MKKAFTCILALALLLSGTAAFAGERRRAAL